MQTNVSFKVEDKSGEVRKLLNTRIEEVLYAIGLKWQDIATRVVTSKKIVDTGRLRGSLTFITPKRVGTSKGGAKGGDVLTGKAPNNTLIVGTNVTYAKFIELSTGKYNATSTRPNGWTYRAEDGRFFHTMGQPARPFLKPSVLDHKSSYKEVAENILKG